MMRKLCRYIFLLLSIASIVVEVSAQNVLDGQTFGKGLPGAYERQENFLKRFGGLDYPHLREADVMYFKRIWQVMDLKQKINHPFYYPIQEINDRKNLFDVIREGVLGRGEGEPPTMMCFAPDDEEFTRSLSYEEIYDILWPEEEKKEYDDDGEVIGVTKKRFPIGSEVVTRYMLKEDWIWDRQRSERYVRIIGIAPLVIKEVENAPDQYLPLFWIYYEDARFELAHADVFNLYNDAQRRTFDELFQKRYFSSYIVKESNVYDRPIVSYAIGMDALAESERIKEELFLLEHDLWHY